MQTYTFGVDEVGRGPLAGPVTVCVFVGFQSIDKLRKKSKNTDNPFAQFMLKDLFNGALRDSKKLKEKERVVTYKKLLEYKKDKKCDWAVASKSAEEIDTKGIVNCITECVDTGIEKLFKKYNLQNTQKQHVFYTKENENKLEENTVGIFDPGILFLDAGIKTKYKTIFKNTEQLIKGDEKIVEIACASIIAKVERDLYMEKLQKDLETENPLFAEYGFGSNAGYGTLSHRKALVKYGLTKYHRKSFCKKYV